MWREIVQMDRPPEALAGPSSPKGNGSVSAARNVEPRDRSLPRRALLYYLLVLLVLRIFLAAVLPITPDEAYQIEWARYLDWCYYDHPPMVAWLMKPFLVLFGENRVSVRAPGILAGILFCLLSHRLASEMYPGTRVADRSLVLTGLVFVTAIWSVGISPDPALMTFCGLALLFFYRAAERGRMKDWVLAGVFLGLGFLSKFIAAGFLGAAFLYLVIPEENRRHLKTPGPWVAAGIAAGLFLPVLLWNYANDWLTFKFHFVLRQGGLSFSPATFLSYVGLQLFFFSPVVLVACVWYLFKGIKKHLKSRNELFLVLFAGVPLAGFAFISLFRAVGGHWTTIAMIPLMVFFARLTDKEKSRTYAAGLATAAGLSLVIVVLAIGILLAGPRRVHGLLKAAGQSHEEALMGTGAIFAPRPITEVATELKDATGGFCATKDYSLSSVFTNLSSDKTHWYVWGSKSKYGRNYDLWDDPADLKGRTMIFVGWRRRTGEKFVRKMLPHFKSLVIHQFNRDEGEEMLPTLGAANVTSVQHDAPFGCGAFIIIEGERFSGLRLYPDK